MGIFTKLFGKGTETTEEPAQALKCPHTVLIPRWDRAEDMGDESKAVTYVCESCGAAFDPEEASEHKRAAAERLKRITATGAEEAAARTENASLR